MKDYIKVYLKRTIGIVLLLMLTISICSCSSFKSANNETGNETVVLAKNNWNPEVYKALADLIDEYGSKSPNYNPDKKPYAVFDWDNTSIINDVEEGVLLYQLINLDFKMNPEELDEVIRKDIPETNFSEKFNNSNGEAVNINLIAADIISDYTYLYENYSGLKGTMSLDEIKKTLQYKDFIVKLRYLYEAIGGTFSADISYPWVIYLFRNMTETDVKKLAEESIDYWMQEPLAETKLISPEELPGNAGCVSMDCFTGIRTVEEMKNLYNTLMSSGFDVYVCSASFVDVIKTFAANAKYGYNLPEGHVIAMELERDKNGKIIAEYRTGYDQTQSEGKTKNIEKFLVSKYGYGPCLIGGDSDGDYNMLTDFKSLKIGLIIDRHKTGKISKLYKKAGEGKYYLQGRDENKGEFIPTHSSVLINANN